MPKDIIRYQHNDTNICVRDYWNKTQLLFDDVVVDARKGMISFGYSLHGKIGNDLVDVNAILRLVGESVQLSANGCVVAKAWKA